MRIMIALGFLIASQAFSLEQKGLFIGSIQFPSLLTATPHIRIYYAGRTVACETNDDTKKVTFCIPEFKQRTFFYVLVSPAISFAPQNTVPYLTLKQNCPYKFFVLQRVAYEPKNKKRKSDPSIEYGWIINELSLAPADGRIPDDTIIICYNPDFIEGLQGGNAIEFPKLMIKKDIIKLVGSEEKLLEISNGYFLAALHSDTIHETIQTEFLATAQPKTIIAMTA